MRRNTWRTTSTIRRIVLGATIALAIVACGGGQDDLGADETGGTSTEKMQQPTEGDMGDMSSEGHEDMDSGGTMDDGMDMGMSGFGEPADPSEADRTIEVNVDNDLAFEPADFEVAPGEVVTFRITNTGDVEHEFVLGDEAAQDEMAAMMEGGDGHGHSGEMSNAVTIHAGETGELTWRFTSEGTVLIGCHVPGHWEAGMQGTVTVH